MKKFFILLVLAIVSISTSAQAYLGGSLGFEYDISEENIDFTVSPEFGYNVNDKWAVGGTLSYSYLGEYETHSFVLQPYARYTFAKVADDKLHFFCDGTVGIGIVGGLSSDTGCVYQLGVKPGISYSFNNHWSMVAHLGFLGYNGADDFAQELGFRNNIGFNFGSLNLSFGVYYSF